MAGVIRRSPRNRRHHASRGLIESDAIQLHHGNNGNGARPTGSHWTPTPAAGRRHHLANDVSGAAPSQLPALFLGPTGVAHWYLDAANRDELVRLRNHE